MSNHIDLLFDFFHQYVNVGIKENIFHEKEQINVYQARWVMNRVLFLNNMVFLGINMDSTDLFFRTLRTFW